MKYAVLMFSIHLYLLLCCKTLRFKASVLFGIPTLFDKSLIVLQLLMHPSNLIVND